MQKEDVLKWFDPMFARNMHRSIIDYLHNVFACFFVLLLLRRNMLHFINVLSIYNVIGLHYSCSSPAGIYLLKVNNRNARARCEICSKLTLKTPE